ncbi:hypothetical protein ACP70R_042640 [Stipagrostis hirtigluma subsp. patula]
MNRVRTAYIIDYACFKAKGDLHVPMATFIEHMHLMPFHDEKAVRFMSRVLERSGSVTRPASPLHSTIFLQSAVLVKPVLRRSR